jgi:AmmeMemoRadiSam system protein B
MPFTHRLVGTSGRSVRPPAVAGMFYPDDPVELARVVDKLLLLDVPEEPLAPAYVVPHAGYRYSGATAAHVFARLRAHAGDIRRVVIVGPSHHVPVDGCAITAAASWRTPLGELAVDPGTGILANDGHGVIDEVPHRKEHAIEVQLPFLQRAVGQVAILPIAVGSATADDLVVTIAAAIAVDEPGTVLLCSTDLSHYQTDEAARRQDDRTIQAIEALGPERIGVRDACGVFALRGTIGWARHSRLAPRVLHHATSAEATGDYSRVVGYPAVAFGPAG